MASEIEIAKLTEPEELTAEGLGLPIEITGGVVSFKNARVAVEVTFTAFVVLTCTDLLPSAPASVTLNEYKPSELHVVVTGDVAMSLLVARTVKFASQCPASVSAPLDGVFAAGVSIDNAEALLFIAKEVLGPAAGAPLSAMSVAVPAARLMLTLPLPTEQPEIVTERVYAPVPLTATVQPTASPAVAGFNVT